MSHINNSLILLFLRIMLWMIIMMFKWTSTGSQLDQEEAFAGVKTSEHKVCNGTV